MGLLLLTAGKYPISAQDTKLFALTPEQVAIDLETDFDKAERLLGVNAIGAGRGKISLIKYNISKYRRFVTPEKSKSYDNRLANFTNRTKQKVDSLIKENLSIIEKNGNKSGYKFRQYLAIQAGLFETELLPVDNALAERAEEYTGNNSIEKTAPPASPPPSSFTETTLQPPVPSPALSPEAEQENDENERHRATALSTASKINDLMALGNIDEASTVFNIHEQQLRRFLDEGQFLTLKKTIDAASTQQQRERIKSTATARNIERLLDQDRVTDAFAELQSERESLKNGLDADAMRLLEKKVGQAYSSFLQKQAAANRTMREIRNLLALKNSEDAYGLFELSQPELERYLYPDAFKILLGEVNAAYGSVQDKKNLSFKLQRDIRLLCRNGRASDASNLFAGNQNLLQQHLPPKEYSALEGDVERAKRDLRRRQVQAVSDAAAIESLLSGQRVPAAWSLFDANKESLKKFLIDKNRFLELKERVTTAYGALREAQSKARSASNRILSLCDRREGKKAYALFKQESVSLRKYCDRGVYTKLESRVTIANAAYDANQAAARSTCVRINELLSQKQVQRAHTEYKKAEEDIFFYLADDPVAESLEKREAQAWNAHQERNRWAASIIKQIHGLIRGQRGDSAFVLLGSTRPELQKYIDQPTLLKVDTDANLANQDYIRKKAAAERNAALVITLLDQKRTEDAGSAFDTLESDLRFYCRPAAFDAIKTRVEASNNLLKDKKGEAQRTVASINSLIAALRGDSASVLFSRNSTFLINFCTAATYKKTSERVEHAKKEYDKNIHDAHNLSARLKAMALHDREEVAAYEQFKEKRAYLAHYLDKNSFSSLEAVLRAPYDAFMTQRKEAHVFAAALKRMLRDGQYSIAKFQFDQNNKQLGRYLPADEYVEIMTRVATSYSNSIHGRKAANATAGKIRDLLHENRASDARTAYKESREMLEKYLPQAEFESLQTEVSATWEAQEKTVIQARNYARLLKSRLAKSHSAEACRDFAANRDGLSEYLDAQTFADLETAMTEACNRKNRKTTTGK